MKHVKRARGQRATILKSLGMKHWARCAEIVCTLFYQGHNMDPVQVEPYRAICTFRRMMRNPRVRDRAERVWSLLPHGRPTSRGPVAERKRRCMSLGWNWSHFDRVELPGGGAFAWTDNTDTHAHVPKGCPRTYLIHSRMRTYLIHSRTRVVVLSNESYPVQQYKRGMYSFRGTDR